MNNISCIFLVDGCE